MSKKQISEKCLLCDSKKAWFLFPHLGNSIIKCVQCGLVSTYPKLPEKEERQRYIKKEYFLESQKMYQQSRERIFTGGLNLIDAYRGVKSQLLDIGCNNGYFLKKARDRGWRVSGVEPSERAAKIARGKFSLEVFNGVLEEAKFLPESFDAVTLWMVLDQLSNPLDELKEIYRILKRDGVVLIRVSNGTFHSGLFHMYSFFKSFFLKFLGIREPMVFHRYAFSRKTMTKLLKLAGFSDIKILNAVPSGGDVYGALPSFSQAGVSCLKKIFFSISQAIFYSSNKRLMLSSSLVALAGKQQGFPEFTGCGGGFN